jgi:hypothetical protein
MSETITFVFFAVAFALPGLIGVLLGGTAQECAEFSAPPVTEYSPPPPLSHWMQPSY